MMISISRVISQLEQFWKEAAPAGVAIQFGGAPLDASGLEAWYEFWVSEAIAIPSRQPASDRRSLLIDVHCFARGRNRRKVAELADAAQQSLAHAELPLLGEGDERCGWVRLREAQIRELTRETGSPALPPLQHVAVSIQAVVEGS